MKGWVIRLLVVVLCLGLALPALAAEKETVWSKYNMKLYGRVKMDYQYLTGRSSSVNVATNIDTASDYKNDSTNFKAKDTRFGLIVSHDSGEWTGTGRIEMDFYGADAGAASQPRFRIGYVDLKNRDWGTSFRAGKDWQPLSQLHPSTIDFGILLRAGNLWERPEQFTIRQKAGDNLELLATAFKIRSSSTSDETRMPWVGARAALSFEALDGKHLLAANAAYQKDKDDSTKDDVDRWLIAGEFKFSLGPVLLKGEAWYGEGLGPHFSRSSGLAEVDDPTDPSKTDAIAGWGGWVDATVKPMPKWSVTAGVGIDDPDEDDTKFGGVYVAQTSSTFSENLQTYLNTWYSITPAIKVGAEWMWVQTTRTTTTGSDFDDSYSQFLASVFYNF